ncbi:MAG: hypothetical protein PSV22_04210 [Pseudolabrys sp.]|nr:hypothetical protein [Pseudolabrys sp.]
MSGETAQIAEIANQVSNEIFSRFGWKRVGPKDHNFKAFDILEEKQSSGDDADEDGAGEKPPAAPSAMVERDFPADVVFRYDDPYSGEAIFIHFDLKSYAESSLKANTTRKALRSLARAIRVAENSADWKQKFAATTSNFSIHGALFVYNHDNKAPSRVDDFLAKLNSNSVPVPEKKRLYVFTPRRINYLITLLNDQNALIAGSQIPKGDEGEVSVYYPYGVRAKPQKPLLPYASAEQLLGPILVLHYRYQGRPDRGYVVYYDGPGTAVDEYLYLFEMFFKRGFITDDETVHLRLSNADQNALAVFAEARDFFITSYHELPEFKAKMDQIKFHRVTNVVKEFSTVDLGMDRPT